MFGNEQFERHAIEWVAEMGFPTDADPVETAVTIGKKQILNDVRCGKVPRSVIVIKASIPCVNRI